MRYADRPTLVAAVRSHQIAREALARKAVVDAALAISDSDWVWLYNATQSTALDGPVRMLAEAVYSLRALLPQEDA